MKGAIGPAGNRDGAVLRAAQFSAPKVFAKLRPLEKVRHIDAQGKVAAPRTPPPWGIRTDQT